MRLNLKPFLAALFASALAAVAWPASAQPPPSPASPPAPPPPDPNDLLGNITVVAGAGGRALPKIAVVPSVSSASEDVTLRSVVRRDLDLSGEVELLSDDAAPEGIYLPGAPIDVKAWSAKGVEAVVRVSAKPRDKDHAEIRGEVFFPSKGAVAVYDKRFAVLEAKVREGSHRLADRLIGALTGQDGGFASHLTFASGVGGVRRVFTMDADGHDARAVSPAGMSAVAPAFGPTGALFFAAAPPGAPYRVMGADGALVPFALDGSVYGIAFSRRTPGVAVSIGSGDDVRLFKGPTFSALTPASDVKMALHPTWSPSGKLLFSGEGRSGQRIFADGKAITPDGVFASSPTVCNHPDGIRVVFAASVGSDSDLVTTGEGGGGLTRLTQGQGRNTYPACSPDGRLVAFFSTRRSGAGPGLYAMRLDGSRPKLVAPLLGDSLRWDPLPPGDLVELTD